MTNEDDPHTVRSDSIDPVTLEVAEIVRLGMVAWSERIARTALDRLSIPDRRSRATDAVRTASRRTSGAASLKAKSDQL
jgi:hypothetical protein